MKASHVLKALFTAVSLLGAALANAASNPLEPGYYAEKFAGSAPTTVAMGTTVYLDANNPLSPRYGRDAHDGAWVASSQMVFVTYDQSTNPLHSTFKRR
jgi:hypothetical protein